MIVNSFTVLNLGVNGISSSPMLLTNKLECLSLARYYGQAVGTILNHKYQTSFQRLATNTLAYWTERQ